MMSLPFSAATAAERAPAESCEPVAPSSSIIGLVAYCALPPNLVFVRVPNEKGRWMMTHRCVVEVPYTFCKAAAGEPCFSRGESPAVRRYHVGTHTYRRQDYRRWKWDREGVVSVHKPRVRVEDVTAAEAIV